MTTQKGRSSATQTPPRPPSTEPELVITRLIGAPHEVVFKAWTEPEHLIQWWGPRGFTVSLCEMDVRPGGNFRIHMSGPDGVEYPIKGSYRAVVEPVRLVFTENWDEKSAVMSVTFEDQDGKTKLTIHTRFETVGDRDAMQKQGMVEGWTESLQRLEEHLARA